MEGRVRTLGGDDGLLEEALAGTGYGSGDAKVSAFKTGLDDVDRVTGGGLAPGLHLVSGVQGSGRSALLVTLANRGTDDGVATLVVCPVDDTRSFAHRLLSVATRIDRSALLGPSPGKEQVIREGVQDLAERPLLVLGADRLQLEEIGWSLRELEVVTGAVPGLLLIDDLDLLAAAARLDLGAVGRSLASMSNAHGLVILATTTATGFVPSTAQARPTRQHAGGWAAMGPYLRSAWLVHREDLYTEDSPDRGIGELILAWQAHGPTGTVKLAHMPHISTWANLHRSPPR